MYAILPIRVVYQYSLFKELRNECHANVIIWYTEKGNYLYYVHFNNVNSGIIYYNNVYI